ncbi:MAG: hypothetical protein MUC50_20650, partial [Myxococcota bacterium]|nr:hypothetical protein [Myxococcota bacterium]
MATSKRKTAAAAWLVAGAAFLWSTAAVSQSSAQENTYQQILRQANSDSSCYHDEMYTGRALDPNCSECAWAVCNMPDASGIDYTKCCTEYWSSYCVKRAGELRFSCLDINRAIAQPVVTGVVATRGKVVTAGKSGEWVYTWCEYDDYGKCTPICTTDNPLCRNAATYSASYYNGLMGQYPSLLPLRTTTKAVLVAHNGTRFVLLAESERYFAIKTAYFKPTAQWAEENLKGADRRIFDEYAGSPYTVGRWFLRVPPEGIEMLYEPIVGALVEGMNLGRARTTTYNRTTEDGQYWLNHGLREDIVLGETAFGPSMLAVMNNTYGAGIDDKTSGHWRDFTWMNDMSTCNYVTNSLVYANVAFANFNPRVGNSRYFTMVGQADPCMDRTNLNFPIEVMLLDGLACLSNDLTIGDPQRNWEATQDPCLVTAPTDTREWSEFEQRRLIRISDLPASEYATVPPETAETATRYYDRAMREYLDRMELADTDEDTEEESDSDVLATHKGLLEQISVRDFLNTDLYVFRMSNDQLVASKEGFLLNNTGYSLFPKEAPPTGEVASMARLRYTSLVRGAQNDWTYGYTAKGVKPNDPSYDWIFAGPHTVVGENPDGTVDVQVKDPYAVTRFITMKDQPGNANASLRRGEEVRVVVINRATGYMGTAFGLAGPDENPMGIYVGPIVMRPPNLKVEVRRAPQKADGSSACNGYEYEAGGMYQIGSSGKGLTRDECILVYTTWLDENGLPLPAELPGFTGRLAKVNEVGELSGAEVVSFTQEGSTDSLAHFPISPGGPKLQVFKVPQDNEFPAH